MSDPTYILSLACPDRTGIVAAVSGFMAGLGGSIVEAKHHADRDAGRFYMRQEIAADSLDLDLARLRERFQPIADGFGMDWTLTDSTARRRVVILVSKADHCLADLLYRWRSGELAFDLAAVVSNHDDCRAFVEWHGIPYHHVPVPPDDKPAAFQKLAETLNGLDPDTIVLARYMQVLPPEICAAYPERIVNIHHSFLPSFVGARPYEQAYARGVKFVGATCHYVTDQLDEGPIIEQDAARTNHADTVDALVRLGRDIEKAVLARGLRYHLEHRVYVQGRRTIVFN